MSHLCSAAATSFSITWKPDSTLAILRNERRCIDIGHTYHHAFAFDKNHIHKSCNKETAAWRATADASLTFGQFEALKPIHIFVPDDDGEKLPKSQRKSDAITVREITASTETLHNIVI